MSLFLRVWIAALFGAAMTSPAEAAWHEAKSKHFIIYSDENPKALLDYATRLEKFDAAARAILKMNDPVVGDGNRLTIFVMPNEEAVRKLAGDTGGFLSGFYTGRASGSLAFVPRRSSGQQRGGLGADSIFYHEYAHHLMAQELDFPYPMWFVEGFAEFLSTPEFKRDGSVGIGAVPQHRAWGLFNGDRLSLETLLGGTYQLSAISREERESIYGRGWLLTHYLQMGGARPGQLERYLKGIAEGTPPLASAQTAFGDLKQLERDLGGYLRQRRIMTFNVGAGRVKTGAIDVRPVSPGGAKVMLLRAKVKNGLRAAEIESTLAALRQIQAQHPGDELVELTLAEAELDAKASDRAGMAADRALKANPKSAEAMILKGQAVLARAENAKGDQSGALAEARRLFIAANKIDPEDPEPLMEFYRSFVRGGERPTANALAALHYASNLAPQDLGLRMNSAIAHIVAGNAKDARRILVPVAYSPHGGAITEEARRMIARIDAGDTRGALRRPAS
jgi:Flp pilus assembly protein TadD